MFKAIKGGDYDFPSPFWDDIQPGAKDMIGCLLMLDTEKRYTAQQVKTIKRTSVCRISLVRCKLAAINGPERDAETTCPKENPVTLRGNN